VKNKMEWRGDRSRESDEYIVLIKRCYFMCNETTPFLFIVIIIIILFFIFYFLKNKNNCNSVVSL